MTAFKSATIARLFGISKPMVTKAVREGLLYKDEQGFIETTNPQNKDYLSSRKEKLKLRCSHKEILCSCLSVSEKSKPKKSAVAVAKKIDVAIPENVPSELNTLQVLKIPEEPNYLNCTPSEQKNLASAHKIKLEIIKMTLDFYSSSGKLISKREVADVCFDYLERLNQRILAIGNAFADEVILMVKEDPSVARQVIVDGYLKQVSILLKDTKKAVENELK